MTWRGDQLTPVDFCCASLLSGWVPGGRDKPWGFLEGPPSSGKTELLRAFEDGEKRVIARDHLTENAFNSGFRDPDNPHRDPSLLAELAWDRHPRGPKALIVKDASSLTKMRREKAGKIFSDLRTSYDESYHAQSGMLGADCKDRIVFGFLMAGTEDLDEFFQRDQSLGSRTVTCRLGQELASFAESVRLADATEGTDHLEKAKLRGEIRDLTEEALEQAAEFVKSTQGYVDRAGLDRMIRQMANLVVRIRTVPVSEQTYTSRPEGPHRLRNQMLVWADCRALFDGRKEWTPEEVRLSRRIAQDTLPPNFLRVWQALWRGSAERAVEPMALDEIATHAKVTEGMWRQFHQWELSDMLVRHEYGKAWAMNPEVAAMIELTNFLDTN
jgi:hypothetical protein